MRILYVEDEPSLQELTIEFLGMNDFRVDAVSSAEEAIERMDTVHYDAIVSDYQMPNMDGIQLLKYLRSSSNNVPFILFTGRGREEVAIEALNSGADYYLQKGGEPNAQFAELTHHIKRAVERKVATTQLAESREKFRSLVECIGDWRWEMDPDGTLTYSSPQVFDVLGYRPDEMIGQSMLKFIPDPDRTRLLSIVKDLLSKDGKIQRLENNKVHRDGSLVTVESNAVQVISKNGQVLGYRGVDRDITREKETERALKAVNYKCEILEKITWHDILNQMTVLEGNVELLRTNTDPDAQGKYLKKIEAASRSLRKHIEFTTDYQKTGKEAPEWQNVFHSFMVARAMLDTQDVLVECMVSGLEIKADPMLAKAFLNMIDNSLRYGGKVRNISLSMVNNVDSMVLCYTDDGYGIHDRDKEHIFEKGFGKNTGLGLFLIRSILGITGITIEETGKFGEGIRLEMRVPTDRSRFSTNIALERTTSINTGHDGVKTVSE